MIKNLKILAKNLLERLGYEIHKIQPIQLPIQNIPDAGYYKPCYNHLVFSPWSGYGEFKKYLEIAKPFTLLTDDRLFVVYSLALQAINLGGHYYECGVYKGGSAILLGKLISQKDKHHKINLHLFDTFEGMPEVNPGVDLHSKGDFSDISLESVHSNIRAHLGGLDIVKFHKGFIPETFKGLESHKIAFAHIDVDIYQSLMNCCEFIYPRMLNGGFMVFDDYGCPVCPGARKAIDEFFIDKPEVPLVIPTGQAIIFGVHGEGSALKRPEPTNIK